MKKAVITGSFNPVTSGHIYLLNQALQLFDKVYMVMLINPDKTYEITAEHRIEMLKQAVSGYDAGRVEVDYYDGYACDYCKSVGASLMLRGIRNSADLIYELDLRRQNLDFGNIDTMFFITDDAHHDISSSAVRRVGHE